MAHLRPHGAGWADGQTADPVEVMADPPGDGIGPDLTPPDRIEGQDGREFKRLERDHRAAVKDAQPGAVELPDPELHETAEVDPTPHPFPDARVTEPQDPQPEDPRETQAAVKDPREGRGAQ